MQCFPEILVRFLQRNFTTIYGELDIVAQDDALIVFVEVKTRTSDTFGLPEASITSKKLENIQNAGVLWLQAHPEASDDWRIDVISIVLDHQNNPIDIQHFINVTA